MVQVKASSGGLKAALPGAAGAEGAPGDCVLGEADAVLYASCTVEASAVRVGSGVYEVLAL